MHPPFHEPLNPHIRSFSDLRISAFTTPQFYNSRLCASSPPCLRPLRLRAPSTLARLRVHKSPGLRVFGSPGLADFSSLRSNASLRPSVRVFVSPRLHISGFPSVRVSASSRLGGCFIRCFYFKVSSLNRSFYGRSCVIFLCYALTRRRRISFTNDCMLGVNVKGSSFKCQPLSDGELRRT